MNVDSSLRSQDMVSNLKERLEDAEQEAQVLRESSERNEEQLEDLKGDLSKVIDERDRLQDEVDKLQGNAEDSEQQKELESRLHEEIDSLSSVSSIPRKTRMRDLSECDCDRTRLLSRGRWRLFE